MRLGEGGLVFVCVGFGGGVADGSEGDGGGIFAGAEVGGGLEAEDDAGAGFALGFGDEDFEASAAEHGEAGEFGAGEDGGFGVGVVEVTNGEAPGGAGGVAEVGAGGVAAGEGSDGVDVDRGVVFGVFVFVEDFGVVGSGGDGEAEGVVRVRDDAGGFEDGGAWGGGEGEDAAGPVVGRVVRINNHVGIGGFHDVIAGGFTIGGVRDEDADGFRDGDLKIDVGIGGGAVAGVGSHRGGGGEDEGESEGGKGAGNEEGCFSWVPQIFCFCLHWLNLLQNPLPFYYTLGGRKNASGKLWLAGKKLYSGG